MAGPPQTSAQTLTYQIGQLRSDFERHEERDDKRFDAGRADAEERSRRLYEKVEKTEIALRSLIEVRVGELGAKIDGAATNLVNAYNESKTDATYAKGHADGMREGKEPSKTRLAIIQGIASEGLKLVATIGTAILMLAFTGWTIQHAPAPPAPTVGHP